MVWWVLGGCVCAGIGWILFATHWIRVKRIHICHGKIPEAFAGYRIALISDLHDRNDTRGLVKKMQQQNPDVILCAGDMHDPTHTSSAARKRYLALMQQLRQIAPVYVVEGNHDPMPRRKIYAELKRQLHALDVCLLERNTVALERNGETILLSGVGWTYAESFVPPVSERYHVLLCHNPQWFPRYAGIADWVFAGHMHGGFVPLPHQQGLFAPGGGRSLRQRFREPVTGFFPKYCRGSFEEEGSKLFVSVGLGCSGLPFRVMPGELVLAEFEKKSQKS